MKQEHTSPLWLGNGIPSYPRLSSDARSDVCIVGAGIAGLSTAYALACEGLSVVVIDDGAVGAGQSIRTTAHLSTCLGHRYSDLARIHGFGGAKLIASSHSMAIDEIARVVATHEIDCSFERVPGFLFLGEGDDKSTLKRELTATTQAGLNTRILYKAPNSPFNTGQCLEFPDQAQFNPGKYLGGLVKALKGKGGKIFSSTQAQSIQGGKVAAIVQTNTGYTISTQSVVVA